MRVCCVDLNIAARLIGFYGLVVGAIVMVEMSSELGRVRCLVETVETTNERNVSMREEEISGSAAISAWLLGLSLDEFGSRVRHSVHPAGETHPHVHVHATAQDPVHVHVHNPTVTEAPKRNRTLDIISMESENHVYIGFLMFAITYASASGSLIIGSIVEKRWTVIPWLIAHLGTVSAQTAGLVVQVTAAIAKVPEDDQLAPGHPDEEHTGDEDHGASAAPGALILSVFNMALLVYMWIVVIVAMRSWKNRNLEMSTRAAPGDESYVLSELGIMSPYH